MYVGLPRPSGRPTIFLGYKLLDAKGIFLNNKILILLKTYTLIRRFIYSADILPQNRNETK